MTKKDLTGVAALFSGATKGVTEKRATAAEPDLQKPEAVTEAEATGTEAAPEPEAAATTQEAAPTMEVEPTTLQDEHDLLSSIDDKELKAALIERLNKKRKAAVGRPRKNQQSNGIADGYKRTSIIIPVEKWEKIQDIAYMETLTLKEIMELALDMVIDRYESKHGEVKPQQKQKKDIHEIF